MKYFTNIIVALFASTSAVVAQSSDKTLEYRGSSVVYGAEVYNLDGNTFYVDSRLSEEAARTSAFAFSSLREALIAASHGSEEQPMHVLIAPGVYWMDDPDDEAVRYPLTQEQIDGNPRISRKAGYEPFALELDCPWLWLEGLCEDAREVVVACNRGQMHGAVGNFTMFNFIGDGMKFENLTMGNYCNVDLDYPWNPALGRKKRTSSITQSQIAFVNGHGIEARNCRFLSRLNACPLVGGDNVLFDRCYIECGDDALNGSALYYQCRLAFYSSKPFYCTAGVGAIFLDCDLDIYTRHHQCFTKRGGQVAVINSRFRNMQPATGLGIVWSHNPDDNSTCYQSGNTLDGLPLTISPDSPYSVMLDDCERDKLYSVRNLFAEKFSDLKSSDAEACPVSLRLESSTKQLASGDTIYINVYYQSFLFGQKACNRSVASLDVAVKASSAIPASALIVGEHRIAMTAVNKSDTAVVVEITVSDSCGLKCMLPVLVQPQVRDAPSFALSPRLLMDSTSIYVEYALADVSPDKDRTEIRWFRSGEACHDGAALIEVMTSRDGRIERRYPLSAADNGCRLKAVVTPRYLSSRPGEPVSLYSDVITGMPVTDSLFTDFHSLPAKALPVIGEGLWTLDAFKPLDTRAYDWIPDTIAPWVFSDGIDGAKGLRGLMQNVKGARLRYTPAGRQNTQDMKAVVVVAPCKPAGQGFGSATGQYMDICIAFDNKRLSGYGVRIQRIPAFDKAVVFFLVKYEKGMVSAISESVASSCYLTDCKVEVGLKDGLLSARAVSSDTRAEAMAAGAVKSAVELYCVVPSELYRPGFMLQHTGSTGASATMLRSLRLYWK